MEWLMRHVAAAFRGLVINSVTLPDVWSVLRLRLTPQTSSTALMCSVAYRVPLLSKIAAWQHDAHPQGPAA